MNMTCEACSKLSKRALGKIPGVTSAEVDLASGLAKVEAEKDIPWNEIVDALSKVDKQAVKL